MSNRLFMMVLATALVALIVTAMTPVFAEQAPAARLPLFDAERASLKSLSLNAEIQTPKSGNRWATMPMEFRYLAPNKYRSTIKTGGLEGDLIIVADGEFLWEYATKKREVKLADFDTVVAKIREKGPWDLLTVLATPTLRLTELFDEVSATAQENGEWILEIKPKIAVSTYDSIRLRTSADGRIPLFAEAMKGGKIIARVNFKEYLRDAEQDVALFKFEVPEGVRVREME